MEAHKAGSRLPILITAVCLTLICTSSAIPSEMIATWVAGSSTTGAAGTTTYPSSRYSTTIVYDTSRQCYFLFGGFTATPSNAELSDLWICSANAPFNCTLLGPSQAETGQFRVPDTSAWPGTRYQHVLVLEQSAVGDRLWTFGGSASNRLWSYDLKTRMWTWQAGTGNPSQGTPGVASNTNEPESRYSAWMVHVPALNCLVLGGGQATQLQLWSYDITNLTSGAGNWTYWKGNTASAVTGTRGVPDPANYPYPTQVAAATLGSNNYIWLYCGGADFNGQRRPDSVWRLDASTMIWTWIAGRPTPAATVTYSPVPNTLHIADGATTPGSRERGSILALAKRNPALPNSPDVLIYFGSSEENGIYSFDTASTNFTWQGGRLTAQYGTQGVAAVTNWPEARVYAGYAFDSTTNRLFRFGVQPMCLQPDHYLASATECLPCPANAGTRAQNTTRGIEACSCNAGFLQYGAQCVAACPAGTYLSGSSCLECSARCQLCSNTQTCTQCDGQAWLNSVNQCVTTCPQTHDATRCTDFTSSTGVNVASRQAEMHMLAGIVLMLSTLAASVV